MMIQLEFNLVSFIIINSLKRIGHVNIMDTDGILKRIFNSQPERNKSLGILRTCRNCVKADLKKCKLSDGEKRLNDRDG